MGRKERRGHNVFRWGRPYQDRQALTSPVDNAEVHLLIGRDAPELLKVRSFINGPKGAPWAQRLSLGWTISGQTSLDLASGPRHAVVRRTNVLPNDGIALTEAHSNQMPLQTYELMPCPNRFKITGTLSDQQERIRENVSHTRRKPLLR